MTDTAKIVRFNEFGSPGVMKIVTEPLAVPKEGEVRVRVHAIGLNRADINFRRGQYLWKPELPARLGVEAAGVVDAIGPGCSEDWIGKRVLTLPTFSPADYGVYGESAIVPVTSIAEFPDGVSFIDAAASFAQYVTGWGALIHKGKLAKGDYVLLTAASSSIGIAAIQMIKDRGGISIATTRSPQKAQQLLDLGADHVIVDGPEDLVARVMDITGGAGARIVYDTIAGESLEQMVRAAARGALILEAGVLSDRPTVIPMMEAFPKDLMITVYSIYPLLEDPAVLEQALDYLFGKLGSGALKPVISKVFPLEEIVQAHEYLEGGTQVGKIVVVTK